MTHYYWRQVRLVVGRPKMELFKPRRFCTTRLLELSLSQTGVTVQLGHTDGGALVMSTYGRPPEDAARARIAAVFAANHTGKLRAIHAQPHTAVVLGSRCGSHEKL